MSDIQSLDTIDEKARADLVTACRAMHSGQLSFFEGALRIRKLQSQLGAPTFDEDFMPFMVIASETDHLPTESARHLWSLSALKRLEPEFSDIEIWAREIAGEACSNLIARYS